MGARGSNRGDQGRALVARSEIWWAEHPDAGRRPFLVLTRQAAIPVFNAVLAVPVTRTIRQIPTEVMLDTGDGMPEECALSLDNLTRVPKELFRTRITRLSAERMSEVWRALTLASGCGEIVNGSPPTSSGKRFAQYPVRPISDSARRRPFVRSERTVHCANSLVSLRREARIGTSTFGGASIRLVVYKNEHVKLVKGVHHVTFLTEDVDRLTAFDERVFDAAKTLDMTEEGVRHVFLAIGSTTVLHPFQILDGPAPAGRARDDVRAWPPRPRRPLGPFGGGLSRDPPANRVGRWNRRKRPGLEHEVDHGLSRPRWALRRGHLAQAELRRLEHAPTAVWTTVELS